MKQGYSVKGNKKGRHLVVYEDGDECGIDKIRVEVLEDIVIYKKIFKSFLVNEEVTHLLGRDGELEEEVLKKIRYEKSKKLSKRLSESG